MEKFRRLFAFLLPLLLLAALLAGNAQAALLDVGPTVPQVIDSTLPNLGHGYPAWYRDTNRLPLELCLNEAMCFFAPPAPLQAVSFPGNIPDELFFWAAVSSITLPGTNQKALLDMAIEAAYSTGSVVPGAQVTFARMRLRVDTPVAGQYIVTTPFKQLTFNVTDIAAGINFTQDIGIAEGGIFTGALAGSVGPFLYCTDAPFPATDGTGGLYIGKNATLCPVLGSTFIPPGEALPANYFRVQGPAAFGTFTGTDFSIQGKIRTGAIPTPLSVDKATYALGTAGMQVNTFVTTQALANPVNGALLFPANFTLTGIPSALQLTATGIPAQTMTTNDPADGKFFSASGLFTAPGAIPAEVTVTNTNDTSPVPKTVPLVDEVVITKASYSPASSTLSIDASSSDKVTVSTLQAFIPGMTDPIGTLSNGLLNVTFPVTDNSVNPPKTYAIPPATITVASSLGGSATTSVATFIQTNHTLASAAGPNGSISPAGNTSVLSGTNQTYTITPNTGFTVAALVVDGAVLPGATAYTFSNVLADHYINAYFTEQTFTLTASAAANGTITPAGPVTALYGTASSFTVTPNAGFQIASLTADGVTLPVAPTYTFTSITGNHTISATFAPLPTIFSITGAAGPNGTISPAGSTNVAGGGSQSYTITPNTGFVVSALVVDGTLLPGATSHTFSNVTADHYINAYFAAIPVTTATITAAAGLNGTISPSGANLITVGTNQTFTITPDTGLTVTALVVDGVELPGATTFTFTNVTADHYINAYFGP